eukprot:Colp12_sorted_trinity150504_noHs@31527
MENYTVIPSTETDNRAKGEENSLRITTQGKITNYVTAVQRLFKEKNYRNIELRGLGKAINKTVTVVEICKRLFPNLHQITSIEYEKRVDIWKPKEGFEEADQLQAVRHIPKITIQLSLDPLDTTTPGYQRPLSEEEQGAVHDASTSKGRPKPTQRGPRRSSSGGEGGSSRQPPTTEAGASTSGEPAGQAGGAHPKGRGHRSRGRRGGSGGTQAS